MNPPTAMPIDHFLVNRVQARCTGANAHDVHAMLGSYFCLCELAETNAECATRLKAVELKLRAFCVNAELQETLPELLSRSA